MYLLYALRQRKRRVYRFTAVLGMGFFLLGIARIWYMQQQSYTIETILKEQETSLSVEIDASRGWQTENEKTILQGKIEKKERKNNQTRLYLNHVFLRIGDNTYKTNSVLVRMKQEPSDQSCRIGTTIVLEGNIRQLNRAANDGNYDEFQYYHSLNMDYHFDAERICGEYGREDVLAEKFFMIKEKLKEDYINNLSERNAGILGTMLLGDKELLEKEVSTVFQQAGASHVLVISGVKTLKLDIPLVPEIRINWAFMPLHIAIIYILKLCLDEEIIPRCRFPCSRGYHKKYINWQKKQSFSVSQSYCKSLINQQKEKKPMAYKKYREMKVYEASGYQYKRTPSIVLKGQWLSELGFDIGEQIEVKCEDGRLIITKANEIWT